MTLGATSAPSSLRSSGSREGGAGAGAGAGAGGAHGPSHATAAVTGVTVSFLNSFYNISNNKGWFGALLIWQSASYRTFLSCYPGNANSRQAVFQTANEAFSQRDLRTFQTQFGLTVQAAVNFGE